MNESVYKDLGSGRSIFYGWGEAMHTRVDILLCHRPQAECEAAARAAIDELKRFDARLNKFDPSSDIARINALAADQPVPVDDEIWGILTSALRYGARTDFHFDITYASKKGTPQNRLHLGPEKHTVLFKTRGTEIDLGGYGKGYGLEKVRDRLIADGWTDFLLNFGNSTVCARGNRPGTTGWSIGVENQLRTGANALEITLRDQSLNTSGNIARHTRHIWSSTDENFIGNLGSISVVTENPLDGEILSTAIFSASSESPPFLKNFPGAKVYGIKYDGGTATVKVF